MQDATKRQQIVAERSFSRERTHSLDNELILWRMSTESLQNGAKRHQIAAERSKMTPHRCITQQNGAKLMHNVAK